MGRGFAEAGANFAQRKAQTLRTIDQLKDFPWLDNRIDIGELCRSFSKAKLKSWGLIAWLYPLPLLRRNRAHLRRGENKNEK